MPTLYIVRGLPGSGKSTFARELQAKTGALFVEPDMFLMSDGRYLYTAAAYQWAVSAATRCVLAAVQRNADVIFADVLPRKADICHFLERMEDFGKNYLVKVFARHVTPKTSKQWNTHNVKTEDIDRMAREWEDWPWEQVITTDGIRNDTEETEND